MLKCLMRTVFQSLDKVLVSFPELSAAVMMLVLRAEQEVFCLQRNPVAKHPNAQVRMLPDGIPLFHTFRMTSDVSSLRRVAVHRIISPLCLLSVTSNFNRNKLGSPASCHCAATTTCTSFISCTNSVSSSIHDICLKSQGPRASAAIGEPPTTITSSLST